MKKLLLFRQSLMMFILMSLICGVLYTITVTGLSQVLFPSQAGGSVISITLNDGKTLNYGSELLAQEFSKPEYLIGRPMIVSNLSPVSNEQKSIVQTRIDWLHSIDPNNKADIPNDLVLASGSGVDPNISLQAAEYQVNRIANVRQMDEEEVRAIIKRNTTDRFLGIWGEPVVNVLKVNLMLDGLYIGE